MPTLKDLRDERATVWDAMKAAETAGLDKPDHAATWDTADARYDELDEQIERQEKHAAREASNARVDRTGVVPPVGSDSDEVRDGLTDHDKAYAHAFGVWLRGGQDDLDPADRAVLRSGAVAASALPRNAAGVGTGAAGGFTVPPLFRDQFIQTLKWFGPMLQVAETLFTTTGANIPWPTNDDTGNVGAILGENVTAPELDVVVGQASLNAYMYTSKLVKVSYQLMQDRPDFDTWLAVRLGERVGRILNQHWTTGTGVSQPLGIVTGATVGTTSAGSFATTGGFSYDNIIDLEESMDPAYGISATGGDALQGLVFMAHQSARKAARKLKDTSGRYLWQPSMQDGLTAQLDGFPFVLNNDMPALAVGSKSILFGSIREAYVCRIVRELTTLRLVERFADALQVGFLGFERADGTVQNANAVRVLQTTATA